MSQGNVGRMDAGQVMCWVILAIALILGILIVSGAQG
jgi:hypothetical protein